MNTRVASVQRRSHTRVAVRRTFACATRARRRAVRVALELEVTPSTETPETALETNTGDACVARVLVVCSLASHTQRLRVSYGDHQSITQPLVTFAVAGGQKVVDALRYQAA